MKPHRLTVFLFVACVLSSVVSAQPNGRTNERARILFLHLKMSRGAVSYLGSSVRQGTLKISRNGQGGAEIDCAVISTKGEVVFSDALQDPSIRRYEYEDPLNPGRLMSRQVILDDVEFTVRIPYSDDIRRVEFYRGRAQRGGTSLLKSPRDLIGTVLLGEERGRQ